MTDYLPWIVLAAFVAAGLLGVFIAWRILIALCHLLIRIDRALFPPRSRRVRVAPLDLEDAEPSGDLSPAQAIGVLRRRLVIGCRYTDRRGGQTARTILADRVLLDARGHPEFLEGVCTTRHAVRTFRISAMRDVVDLGTGEVIDDPAAWLLDRLPTD